MQTFNIDISRKNAPLVLYAKQGDSLSRFFKIVFLQDGVPWEPPAGALFSVRFGAPGMPDGWYDTIKEQDGSTHSAFSLVDNILTVELAYEAVSKAGTNTLAVLVLDANGYQLGAWNLHLDVELTPGENSPEADVYYSLLSEQVAQVLQAKDDAQASAILSQSWAVGGTSSRAGEDTNNSEYWAARAQQFAQEAKGLGPSTPVAGFENGNYFYNNNGVVGAKTISASDVGAAPAVHTHTKSQITDFPTSMKNPAALTLQFNGSTNQTYDGSVAKTFNVTPTVIGALPADQPAVSAEKASKPTFAVNYGRIVSPDNRGLYIRNAESEGSGVFVGVREEFQTLSPDTNTSGTPVNLGGPSYRWRTLYLQNQPDVSSDQNMKEQIEPLSEKQMLFFDALKPVQYKLKGSSHDRLHYGFIAQEVEQAMAAAGISDMEFGGFCKDNKIKTVKQYSEQGELLGETEESMDGYEYSLRYGEFIALNTAAIQALKKRIVDLETKFEELKGEIGGND